MRTRTLMLALLAIALCSSCGESTDDRHERLAKESLENERRTSGGPEISPGVAEMNAVAATRLAWCQAFLVDHMADLVRGRVRGNESVRGRQLSLLLLRRLNGIYRHRVGLGHVRYRWME